MRSGELICLAIKANQINLITFNFFAREDYRLFLSMRLSEIETSISCYMISINSYEYLFT